MNVPTLGPLKPHPDVPEWLAAEPREIPFFGGRKLLITLDSLEETDEQDVEHAIASFLKLGPADRLAISRYVFANYRTMAELVSEEDLGCRNRKKPCGSTCIQLKYSLRGGIDETGQSTFQSPQNAIGSLSTAFRSYTDEAHSWCELATKMVI